MVDGFQLANILYQNAFKRVHAHGTHIHTYTRTNTLKHLNLKRKEEHMHACTHSNKIH